MKPIGRTIAFCAVIAASVITYGAAAKPRAHLPAVTQSQAALEAPVLDRSRKGDRLDSARAAVRVGPPPGCEAPFSPLAKFSRSDLIGRCVT
jgi:hypothetical protein